MSMILDALARAERERKQEHTDVSREEHFERPPARATQPIKPWVLLAVVINLLILGAIFFYFYTQNTNQETTSGGFQTPETTQESASTIDSTARSPVVPESNALRSDELVDQEPKQSAATSSLLAEAQVQTLDAQTSPNAVNMDTEPERSAPVEPSRALHQEALVVGVTPVPKAKPAPKPKVSYSQVPLTPKANTGALDLPKEAQKTNAYPLVNDLSSDVRSRLSKYEVNVHVHDSKPRNRFVLINMTKYREGDQIASGGPRIVEITTDGVVVDYGGGKALMQRN